MSASTNREICCGFCDAPIRPWAAGDHDSDLGCIACDNWATADEVVGLLNKYAGNQDLRAPSRYEQDANRGKIVPFKVQTVPHQIYRVISGGRP